MSLTFSFLPANYAGEYIQKRSPAQTALQKGIQDLSDAETVLKKAQQELDQATLDQSAWKEKFDLENAQQGLSTTGSVTPTGTKATDATVTDATQDIGTTADSVTPTGTDAASHPGRFCGHGTLFDVKTNLCQIVYLSLVLRIIKRITFQTTKILFMSW